MRASCIRPDTRSAIIGPLDPRRRSESRHVTSRAAIGGKAHTQPPSGLAPPPNSRNPASAGVCPPDKRDHTHLHLSPCCARSATLSLHPFPRLFCPEPSPVTPCFPSRRSRKVQTRPQWLRWFYPHRASLNSHDIRRRWGLRAFPHWRWRQRPVSVWERGNGQSRANGKSVGRESRCSNQQLVAPPSPPPSGRILAMKRGAPREANPDTAHSTLQGAAVGSYRHA